MVWKQMAGGKNKKTKKTFRPTESFVIQSHSIDSLNLYVILKDSETMSYTYWQIVTHSPNFKEKGLQW